SVPNPRPVRPRPLWVTRGGGRLRRGFAHRRPGIAICGASVLTPRLLLADRSLWRGRAVVLRSAAIDQGTAMSDRAAIAKKAAAGLRKFAAVAPSTPVMIGFDGFVDSIIHVVDKRTDSDHYQPVPT